MRRVRRPGRGRRARGERGGHRRARHDARGQSGLGRPRLRRGDVRAGLARAVRWQAGPSRLGRPAVGDAHRHPAAHGSRHERGVARAAAPRCVARARAADEPAVRPRRQAARRARSRLRRAPRVRHQRRGVPHARREAGLRARLAGARGRAGREGGRRDRARAQPDPVRHPLRWRRGRHHLRDLRRGGRRHHPRRPRRDRRPPRQVQGEDPAGPRPPHPRPHVQHAVGAVAGCRPQVARQDRHGALRPVGPPPGVRDRPVPRRAVLRLLPRRRARFCGRVLPQEQEARRHHRGAQEVPRRVPGARPHLPHPRPPHRPRLGVPQHGDGGLRRRGGLGAGPRRPGGLRAVPRRGVPPGPHALRVALAHDQPVRAQRHAGRRARDAALALLRQAGH